MLSEGGSFCAHFGERAVRWRGGAKTSPYFVVVRSENARFFAKVSPIWRHYSLFSDGNAESMRDAPQCGGGRGAGVVLCPWGVRKFRAGRRETAGEGYKKSPERRWAVRGMRVESGLFQAVGLGAETVDLGFVGRDDDVDVANVAEIGAEHHVETVALAVGRIGDAVNAPNEDARRENRGVARRFDDVAGAHLGVARHVVDVGFARTAAVPEEIAEVVTATHAAGDARLAVGDGKHEGVARTDEIDDADYAATAHNAHFGTDAVGTSAVEHEVAVAARAHVVAHYAGGEQAETTELLQHAPFGVGAVVEGFGQGVAKAGVLTLQTEVVVGEGAVDVAQIEETLGFGVGAIELGGAFTGGGEPYTPLIVVEAEKEGETHDLEHDKQEDVVVATEKIEENLHGVGRFLGRGLLSDGRSGLCARGGEAAVAW